MPITAPPFLKHIADPDTIDEIELELDYPMTTRSTVMVGWSDVVEEYVTHITWNKGSGIAGAAWFIIDQSDEDGASFVEMHVGLPEFLRQANP
jgi:hypothetical protein